MSVLDLVEILSWVDAFAASTACRVTDRWFPPHFSLFSTFGIDGSSADVSCPIVSQPLCQHAGLTLLIGQRRL